MTNQRSATGTIGSPTAVRHQMVVPNLDFDPTYFNISIIAILGYPLPSLSLSWHRPFLLEFITSQNLGKAFPSSLPPIRQTAKCCKKLTAAHDPGRPVGSY